jgi:hypothetical protein
VEPADRAVAGALLVEEVDVAVVERREERLPADVLEPVSPRRGTRSAGRPLRRPCPCPRRPPACRRATRPRP